MTKSMSILSRIIIMFLFTITLTIVGGQKVLAAQPTKVGPVVAGQIVGGKTYFPIKTAGNYKAFCTSGINVDVPSGRTCTLITNGQWSEGAQAGVAAIIEEYNNGKISGKYNSYWYAEMAINSYIRPGSMIVRAENGEQDSIVKSLVAKAKEAEKKASAKFTLTTSNNELTFTKSGDNYVSNKITVSGTYIYSFNVTVSGTNNVKVINKTSNSFQVSFPASNLEVGKTINVTAKVTAKKSYKTAKNYSCGSGVQNITINYLETATATATATISGKITRKGNALEITKVDPYNNKNVAGATLVLKNSSGKQVATWVTTTSAKKFTNLAAGTYTLIETKAPEGYKKSYLAQTITIKEDGKTVKVTFDNYPETGVKIQKVDAVTGKNIAGAKLQVKNAKGTVVKTITSEAKAIELNLDAGDYTLTEIEAPKGYKLTSEPVKFTVSEKGEIATVRVKNYPETGVKIQKVDGITGKTVAGAKLQVKNAKGTVVKTITSETKPTELKIDAGDYTLTEVEAPKGYKITSEPVKFTVNTNGEIATVTMKNYPNTGAKISKVDVTNSKELPGATLVIKDASGKEIKRWVSTTEPTYFELDPGKYTLTETIAPQGYKLSKETIEFEVKNDGTIDTVTMKNAPITGAQISKVNVTNGKELPGAPLVIKDSKGKEIKSWVSTTEPTYFELDPGKYTLTETIAPKGFKLSTETIEFEVKEDGTTTQVKMENEPLGSAKISKQDITNKQELPGATLVVKDANGKEIIKWVSSYEPKYIELAAGKYTLTETIAPKGYKLSTETIEFEVKNDGSVTPVVMYNEPNKTGANISKQDITNKQELPGATLVIKDASGKEIKKWVSTNEPTYFDLTPGKYTLTETIAPKGYKLSTETIEFEVKEDGTITKVVMYNEPVTTGARISKQDITNKQELPGATLVVKDANGNEVASWVSTSEPHYIELTPGSYTLTETIAPAGYKLSTETISFEVASDGTITPVVMYNEPNKTGIRISKQDITTKEELPGATLVIKDLSGNEIARWVSTSEPRYIELEPGEYMLTEIEAPNGYDLSYEVVRFTVDSEGNTASDVVMYNSKTPVTADRNLLLTTMGFIGAAIIGAVAIKKLKHQM